MPRATDPPQLDPRIHAADPRWEAFAAAEPYFAVLTAPRFRQAELTPLVEREFFGSGEALVAWMLNVIDASLSPGFAPMSILEYGCGVGRLAFPLAQRPGAVTAVDRSPAMLAHARREAERRGIGHIRFETATNFWTTDGPFELVVCYQVLQRLPAASGLSLLRALVRRIGPHGVGVFHLPIGSRQPAWIRGARWLRTHSHLADRLAARLRGRSAVPFTPTTIYDLDTVLEVFDLEHFRTHVALDRDQDLDSAVIIAERRERSGAPRAAVRPKDLAAAGGPAQMPTASDVEIDRFNQAAELYFASLTNWDHHLAKPFSNVDETPALLTSAAVTLDALRLRPGMTVLDFGAGPGWLSRCLTQMGCRVVVLDVSATALDIARELYRRVPVIGDPPAPSFVEFDGRTIPLPDGSVDRVVCFDAFHHTPNPAAVIREFARILAAGGLAVFAEPGPRHADAPRSRFEAETYGVVENDIDVHAIWRAAQASGFTDVQMCVFNGTPYHVPLDRYADLLAGGVEGESWLTATRTFLRYVRNFVLVKGVQSAADSRGTAGLACEVRVGLAEATVAKNQPISVAATVTNTGTAVWLPSTAGRGGVALGAHLRDAEGALLTFDFHWQPLTAPPRAIGPGEVVRCRFDLPALLPGAYTLEFDCVAADVTWFAQAGSRTATIAVVVED